MYHCALPSEPAEPSSAAEPSWGRYPKVQPPYKQYIQRVALWGTFTTSRTKFCSRTEFCSKTKLGKVPQSALYILIIEKNGAASRTVLQLCFVQSRIVHNILVIEQVRFSNRSCGVPCAPTMAFVYLFCSFGK